MSFNEETAFESDVLGKLWTAYDTAGLNLPIKELTKGSLVIIKHTDITELPYYTICIVFSQTKTRTRLVNVNREFMSFEDMKSFSIPSIEKVSCLYNNKG